MPERRPDVLLATAPPFGVAVLARELACRYRLPWVADFRDPWTLWCAAPYPTIAHYAYARAHEGVILRSANAAIATSHVTRDQWLTNDRRLDSRRLHTIYNGFESANRDSEQPAANGSGLSPRRVVHTGSFYYTPEARSATYRPAWRRQPHQWLHYRHRREDWLYRSPYFFLRGLRAFLDTYPHLVIEADSHVRRGRSQMAARDAAHYRHPWRCRASWSNTPSGIPTAAARR